ncbi:Na+/H+ antiporter subunit D [Edaphobacillus lindanitolerans]|uniref:Multisubunit sodium/proton antiporter, MrpD subunit n=1 Tax=Edaphobacillus lindanitolerans TaxID=550447 RepID=A0A1U7PM56_9BACI|nr:Na+/H+ antiporter subunit D [Edaphobacillus lindanitolerans]SIT89315.1 multisubunit sodium/proton antiporter, MrpD subunit [Edaphobacillus lindanitolerans]
MNNILVLPMVIPLLTGFVLFFLRPSVRAQKLVASLSILSLIAVSVRMLLKIRDAGILRLDFGGWKPPFGILFVGDSFAALLVLTTSIVSGLILFYAFAATERRHENMFFYPFSFFLVAGVNGSLLTGDLFNLFVCFEVMLLASYVLVTLGGGKSQLAESMKYVAINVVASWFFLVALAFLYGTIGTLNMAHISVRVAEAGQGPLLSAIAVIFLIVFALKAGLLLYFWLPGSYSSPPAPVAALFAALLTKVGVYAMFRVFTLIFYHDSSITHGLIGAMAVLTLAGGSLGAVAYKDIRVIASYNVVIAVGFMMLGLAVFNEAAFRGSVYYLIHDMVIKALLFLAVGSMILLTGESRIDRMSGLIRNYPLLGWLFFITMLSLAGIPPFSGFIGKVYTGLGAVEGGNYWLLLAGFLSSLFVLYSLLRIFMNCFWGETTITREEQRPLNKKKLIPLSLLGALTLAIGVGTQVLAPFVADAAHVLANPEIYIEAVLGEVQPDE